MWANTVWGFIALAVTAGGIAVGLGQEWIWLQPWLFISVPIFIAAALISAFWPLLFATSRALKRLDEDARYLMAIEGVVLKRENFGPFAYGDGDYGGMSWDRARSACHRLLGLGLIKTIGEGQYSWTRRGKAVLKRLSPKDAEFLG